MNTRASGGNFWSAVWFGGAAVSAATLALAGWGGRGGLEASPGAPDPTTPRLHPTLVYGGNGSCAGSSCHSGDARKLSYGAKVGAESKVWEDGDPHAKAYKALTNDTSKKVIAAIKIDDATKSDRCLSCHSTNVPDKQRGEKFKDLAANAVGCESCHGPGEKWAEAHAKEGWMAEQRKLGTKGLEDKWGMRDTKDVAVRAQMCVTCHLQIDKDMVDAGHPALNFEMYYYNNYEFKDKFKMHWPENKDPARNAQLWAIGQVVAAAAADAQAAAWKAKGWKTDEADALAKMFGEGRVIVKTVYGTDDAMALDTVTFDKAKSIKAVAELVSKADAYKSGPAFKHQRDVITNGVDALVNSCYADAPPDAYADIVDKIGKKDGDAWMADIKKMAAYAK